MPLPRIAETFEEHLRQRVSDWMYGFPDLEDLNNLLEDLDEAQLNYVWKRLQWISEQRFQTEDFSDPSVEEIRSIIKNSKRITFFKDAVSEVIN